MAFRKSKKLPEFADLVGILARSRDTDNALYQTIQEIINRLDQFVGLVAEGGLGGGSNVPGPPGPTGPIGPAGPPGEGIDVQGTVPSEGDLPTTGQPGDAWITADDGHIWFWDEDTGTWIDGGDITGPPGPPGPTPTLDQSFITVNAEASLPNERRLIAGANITLDVATPGQITIAGQAGGGGSGGMEYRGDYVPGTYNDGDIVVYSDGIAYVCTVNGTTTPPEPWPGGGLATSDGTYWTVSPHAGLANERALSSLANGYVKSTGGEPSTVAAIPPGDLPPYIAYTNVDNLFVPQTFASGSNVTGPGGQLYFRDTSAPAQQKLWRFINYADGYFRLHALTDDASTVIIDHFWTRDGYAVSPYFMGNGSQLTALNASQLTTGLVATARLGSGTANSTTFLRGDSTWQVPPVPAGVPSGALILMTSPCPPGYTRVAGWDGYYARMGPTHTSGGASQHQHGPGTYTSQNHAHGVGTLEVPGHTHSAGGLTVSSHNHGNVTVGFGISGNTGGGGGHDHSVSGTTGGENNGILSVDGGASGNCTRGTHTHTFSATTSSESNHTHSFSGSGSGSGATGNASPGVTGNTGSTGSNVAVTGSTASAGAAAITGASDIQLNNPLFIDFYACRKD